MLRLFLVAIMGMLLFRGALCDDKFLTNTRFETPFEQSDGWESASYEEGIEFYRALASASPRLRLDAVGRSDSGPPIHLVLISEDRDFDTTSVRAKGRAIMLINNGIHPGEPDGIDASMAFVRDMVLDEEKYRPFLTNVMVAVIPFYNIGGAMNRNGVTRVNQNGPRAYGFRGNARNYDLNRDFIKCDTMNARSFAQIFHRLDPELLIDTHVSNGADYQYVMTTAHSQKDKLGLKLGIYLERTFESLLFDRMRKSGFATVPYVNALGEPPDRGFSQFLDTPRYSTGFAALFQTIGFMTETHMLKPYPQRVAATRAFLQQSLELLSEQKEAIQRIRREDRKAYPQQKRVAIAWEVDKERPSKMLFEGYQATYVSSNVTSGDRLMYDRAQPYKKEIDYFNNYQPSRTVTLPKAYLIPRGWHGAIDLLKLQGINMHVARQRATVRAEVYHLNDISTRTDPFEGHFFHDAVSVAATIEKLVVHPGDVLIPVDQDKARYVVETLEPEASDSFFRWNFFDTVLQRKEHFSSYVFEETAARVLTEDAELKARFEKRKQEDAEFASDRRAQLSFLYRHSRHYESAHRRYPIARLLELPQDLSVNGLKEESETSE